MSLARFRQLMRPWRIGLTLVVLSLLLIAPHLTSGTELVRIRQALALGPDLPLGEDWKPPNFPPEFRRETVPPEPYFVAVAESLGLMRLTDDWERAVLISPHLLESSPQLVGEPVKSDLGDTHLAITREGRGYCGDFVRVFTALANVAGITTRPWGFSFDGYGGHGHIWLEIWNRQAGRWQLLDVFNNFYFTVDGGGPLSALQLRDALSRGQPIALRALAPRARLGYDIEAKYWDYVRRGLPQWYASEGNNVLSIDQAWAVRAGSLIGRSAENLASIVVGLQPPTRMLAVPESVAERDRMRALRFRLMLAGVLFAVGLATMLVSLRRIGPGLATVGLKPLGGGPSPLPPGCVAVYSPLFPNATEPQAGVFIRERMFRVAGPEGIVVVSPRPWFPLQWLISLVRPDYRPMVPLHEQQNGIDVWFPRFLSAPGVLRRFDSLSMALCTWPLMRRLQRERGVTLIDAHFAYPAGDAAALLGRWMRLPVTITLRGTEARHLADPILRPLVLRALARASRVFCVSDSLRRLAAEAGADATKMHVVGNGVDLTKFRRIPREQARAKLGLPIDAPVLISVGGLVERKGFHRVIDLLPSLQQRFPGLVYLIVGGPSPEGDISSRLREQAAALGVQDAVRFLGPLPPEALHEPLGAADVFVLASSNEGWANVLLEAMACGLPVVATDVGGNREVVASNRLGIVVPFGQPPALEAALADALAAPWDREAIVDYARSNDWSQRVETLRGHLCQVVRTASA